MAPGLRILHPELRGGGDPRHAGDGERGQNLRGYRETRFMGLHHAGAGGRESGSPEAVSGGEPAGFWGETVCSAAAQAPSGQGRQAGAGSLSRGEAGQPAHEAGEIFRDDPTGRPGRGGYGPAMPQMCLKRLGSLRKARPVAKVGSKKRWLKTHKNGHSRASRKRLAFPPAAEKKTLFPHGNDVVFMFKQR